MSSLIDVTGDDIAALGDGDLRNLIGRLCEAEYMNANLSTAGITWGGHQDAPDGGLDVVVRQSVIPENDHFIPRPLTGFQIKKPDMQPAQIKAEMMPNGKLRDSIKEIIENQGAYIIVSSQASTTEKTLKNRRQAMLEAVSNENSFQNIRLDFLDRGRVATWVRSHPSLILWVREKIGRSMSGWKPYDNWAHSPDGLEDNYLLDDNIKLFQGGKNDGKGLSAIAAINALRSELKAPRQSIRLTGLSGVGKTRFVQALFDSRIGENKLNLNQAFYTDISHNPEPDPIAFAEQLIALKTIAILIIDNCGQELHRKLTEICSKPASHVNLITVEYDVRDHLPEATTAYRLEPSSNELVTQLIRKRFSHISEVDSRTIAEHSGGNARVALALANTLKVNESLSSIRDNGLFERLFMQRNEKNNDLLLSAEVLSLVYSFDGIDVESHNSELKILASLIEKPVNLLYRDIKTLIDRDLIQSRGRWRAVLPHAIANWLASRALESTPKESLLKKFLLKDNERLIQSFTRRLNYLHDNAIAKDIAEDWLSENGWIGKNITNLSSFGIAVFSNIAPVSPKFTLKCIKKAAQESEGFATRENPHFKKFVGVLRHLAYDKELFADSVEILCQFSLSEKEDENNNSIRSELFSLFLIVLSGTQANFEDRYQVIVKLLEDTCSKKQKLGVMCLEKTLKTRGFSGAYDYAFGAHPRDYGYWPKDNNEILQWYKGFWRLAVNNILNNHPQSEFLKLKLASHLRGLWLHDYIRDDLESAIRDIHTQSPWYKAWISIRNVIRFDIKKDNKGEMDRLWALESFLKPDNLLDLARVYALSSHNHSYELEDNFIAGKESNASSAISSVEEMTFDLGCQVAHEKEVFYALLPDLVCVNGARLFCFGKGLAKGADSIPELWGILYEQFKSTPKDKRIISVFTGILNYCAREKLEFYDTVLDSAVSDDVFGEWFPILQTAYFLDDKAVERICLSLDVGLAAVHPYRYISYGQKDKDISDDQLARILEKLLKIDDDLDVSLDILSLRFHQKKGTVSVSSRLLKVMKNVILKFPFDRKTRKNYGDNDYELSKITAITLNQDNGYKTALKLCEKILGAMEKFQISGGEYSQLMSSIAKCQPEAFLESFISDEDGKCLNRGYFMDDDFGHCGNPLNAIDDQIIIDWCLQNPESRFEKIAHAIYPFKKNENDEMVFKPIVFLLLEKSTNISSILNGLAYSIKPRSWTGSCAVIMQERKNTFEKLREYDNKDIADAVKQKCAEIDISINKQLKWEQEQHKAENESFE